MFQRIARQLSRPIALALALALVAVACSSAPDGDDSVQSTDADSTAVVEAEGQSDTETTGSIDAADSTDVADVADDADAADVADDADAAGGDNEDSTPFLGDAVIESSIPESVEDTGEPEPTSYDNFSVFDGTDAIEEESADDEDAEPAADEGSAISGVDVNLADCYNEVLVAAGAEPIESLPELAAAAAGLSAADQAALQECVS